MDSLLSCPFCGLRPERNSLYAWCHGPKSQRHILVQQWLADWNTRSSGWEDAGRLRQALVEIASCESHHPGDVVAIARQALAEPVPSLPGEGM